MPPKTILERIIEVFKENLSCEAAQFTEATTIESLRADHGMDSLDEIEILMAAEDEFGVEIPDDVAETWKTLGDAVNWLKENGVSE